MKFPSINLILFLTILCTTTTFAQVDAQSLMHLHRFTDEANFTTITGTPEEGSLIYNEDNKRVYYYAGATNGWTKLSIAPNIIDKTADYTLVSSDDGNVITFPGDADYTLTIPAGLPVGFHISVYQKDDGAINNGNITILGSGATIINRLSNFVTAGDGSGIGIIALEADTYYITGDLKRM